MVGSFFNLWNYHLIAAAPQDNPPPKPISIRISSLAKRCSAQASLSARPIVADDVLPYLSILEINRSLGIPLFFVIPLIS